MVTLFRFRLATLFLLTFVVALLAAGLRQESPMSAIRILGGCLAVGAIPLLLLGPIVDRWWYKRPQSSARPTFGRGYVSLLQVSWWTSTVGFLCLVGWSMQREADRHTDGLTRWLIPLSLFFGTLIFAIWRRRRRFEATREKTVE